MNKLNDNNTEIMAIYFPSWHPDKHYEKWYGKGFSEWELVKSTTPLFKGHEQPKVPLWGHFDESDPVWMEKQVDLAADHGVTGFIFDWYWYNGEKFLEKALEKGFLKSSNRDRLKFSIMWANHNWGKWPAVDDNNPGMNGNENQGAELFLKIKHSPEDLIAVAEYCCKNYFCKDNYWKIDGKPVFSFYDLNVMIEQFGSIEKLAEGIKLMQKTVRKHGFEGMYLSGNIGCCNDNEYCCGWDRVERAKQLGFDSVFAYNIVRTKSYGTIPNEMSLVDYREVMESHQYCWKKIEAGGLTHFPSVTIGLDVSPRWNRSFRPPMDFRALGYEPIIINNTPERFGELCKLALEKADSQSKNAVIINAWNEWTEGMYLLPEKKYGMGYLEALRDIL